MKSSVWVFSLACLALLSCERVEVFRDQASYLQYVEKLNLSATANRHTLILKASITPTEMIALRNGAPIDSIEAWYENSIEIALEITDSNTKRDLLDLYPSNAPEYGQILNYYSSGIRDYVRLVADADTFYPIYSNPVRTYGVLKNNPIVLGFNLDQPLRKYNTLQLFYFDALFYKENILLDLSESDFNKTPKLLK